MDICIEHQFTVNEGFQVGESRKTLNSEVIDSKNKQKMHKENNSEINMENLDKSDHLSQSGNQQCGEILKRKISEENKEFHHDLENEILIHEGCEKRTEIKSKAIYSEMDKEENIRNLDSDSDVCSSLEIDSSNKENVHEANEMNYKSNLTHSKKKNKKEIKEERLKIQSETHRLMREREISLPYHKPKQRTLKEFLSRKKNRANIPLNMPSSKMIDIWKDIEESTQNAFEFFKSDSDSDYDTGIIPEEKVKFSPKLQQEEEVSIGDNNDAVDFKSKNNENDSDKGFEHNNKRQNNINKSSEFVDVSTENINVLSYKKNLVSSSSTNQNDFETTGSKNSDVSNIKKPIDKNSDIKENIIKNRTGESTGGVSKTLNNLKDIDNSQTLQSAKDASSKTVDESNKNEDRNHRIVDWINDIPVYQKVTKQGKKETLLQKLNPKLLELTPKLSGEPDSFIDLENVNNGMEAGAKKLMKRFLQNCVAPTKNKKKEMHLTITTSETNENGIITNIITEDLVYNSTEIMNYPDLHKPGAKLQKLREELKKKIEQKWEDEYKKVTLEMQLKTAREEKEKVEEEEDEEWDEEEIHSETSDRTEESEFEEENIYKKPNTKLTKNPFIISEAEESDSENEDEHYSVDNDCATKNLRSKEENEVDSDDNILSRIEDSESEIGDDLDSDDNFKREIKNGKNGNKVEEESDNNDNSNENDLIDLEEYNYSDVFKRGLKNITGNKDEEYENESIECTLIPPYQPGGGLLNGGSDLTQCDEDDSLPKNILSPTIGLSLDILPEKKSTDNITSSQQTWNLDVDIELPEECNKRKNFVPFFPETENYDLNDAYEFCSGKFPDVGEESETQCEEQDSLHELDGEGCNITGVSSSSFIKSKNLKNMENQHESDEGIIKKPFKKSRLKIISDDSDSDSNIEEQDVEFDVAKDFDDISKTEMYLKGNYEVKSEKPFTRKMKKPMKNLQFSDDEENSESETEKSAGKIEEKSERFDLEEDNEEDENSNIDYDSEEMEIVNPTEFLDKEAELSGSEWSGDEDEKGLDEIDFEDGDNDRLDDNKIRSELGKIHMRHLRDEDNRNVRLLQELLFEDGDLYDDGPKREKNFKWRNIGNSFDDDKEDKEDILEPQDEELIIEDEQSTKTRHEKELFLLQLKNERDENDDEEEQENSLLKLGRVVLDKGTKMKTSDKIIQRSGETAFKKINKVSDETAVALINKRGSFLSRNEDFLSRLAKYTSNATDILGPKNSKNFIFAVKSPEKNKPCSEDKSQPKRKNFSEKNVIMKNKKTKLDFGVISAAPLFLDKLL